MSKRDIPFARPILGKTERSAVDLILQGHVLVHGPLIHEFEKCFSHWTNGKSAVAVSSCTAGLHLAYFSLGIGNGDEVIVPAMSHVATAHAVEYVGAKPIFVDAEDQTGNIDIDQIEAAITEKTKAISIVHYLGMPVDMDRINTIAEKYNILVIEDCALAVGSYYKGIHAGLLGNVGCFSFYPVKHMTTLEGVIVLSNDKEILHKISLERAFGVDRTHGERSVPGQYDVTLLGFNYRMNEVQAMIGIEQIKRLNGFLTTREKNYKALTSKLQEIDEITLLQSSYGDFQSSYYCHSAILNGTLSKRRTEIIESLKKRGVGTSIYYPKPIPCLSYYTKKYGDSSKSFPNASRLAYESIAFPVGPHLDEDDMLYIGEIFKSVITETK